MVLRNISLLPAELKAIEEHKRFMSERDGRAVTVEEALEDFLQNYRNDWLKEKQRRDNEEQMREIERHKWLVSEKRGYDIGTHEASTDWIESYARIWRSYKESLESNGFLELKVLLEGDEGFRLRRGSLFLELVSCFECDFYVHSRGMEYYNLVMNGKEYLHVRSVFAMAELYVPNGEVVEFIATGREAKEALGAVGRLIRGRTQR
jgi:phosphotransferase system HPr-like phosphotransfer protein